MMRTQYVVLRLLGTVPLLAVISCLVFLLIHLAPGDAAQALTGGRQVSEAALEAIRQKYNLNDPLIQQFFSWLARAVQGDLGQSIQSRQDVVTAITGKLPLTLSLVSFSVMLVLAVGLPLGIYAALREGETVDRMIVVGSVVGVSTPAFVTGLFLLYYLGFVLGLFPVYGPGEGVWGRLWHLTLPAVALALSVIAILVKVTRAAMIEELGKDYVGFARARGVPPRQIMLGYALRNALIPVITAASIIVVVLLAGTIYVEVTFALPGLGTLLIDAVRTRDIPLIQGATLFYSAAVIGINLVTDVIYTLIDPRVKLGRTPG